MFVYYACSKRKCMFVYAGMKRLLAPIPVQDVGRPAMLRLPGNGAAKSANESWCELTRLLKYILIYSIGAHTHHTTHSTGTEFHVVVQARSTNMMFVGGDSQEDATKRPWPHSKTHIASMETMFYKPSDDIIVDYFVLDLVCQEPKKIQADGGRSQLVTNR